MELTPETRERYTGIIDSILTVSDLNTISSKRVRTGLQAAVQYDIGPQKVAINALILERFDKFNADRQQPPSQPLPPPPEPAIATNGVDKLSNGVPKTANGLSKHNGKHSEERSETNVKGEAATSDEFSEVEDDGPPKKKVRRSPQDDDAAFAARLQAEENSKARPTRGGGAGTRKKAPAPKKRKVKSKTKVNSDDDSELESGSEKPVKRNGAFHKPFNLSEPLAALVGETQLSRPQTVKKIWEYVKANDLQNPEDKRQIVCDEAMRAVFRTDSVHMFTMNKILSKQLYPIEEP